MDVLNRLQQLVHVGLHFMVVQILVPDQTFIQILLHELKHQGQLA